MARYFSRIPIKYPLQKIILLLFKKSVFSFAHAVCFVRSKSARQVFLFLTEVEVLKEKFFEVRN